MPAGGGAGLGGGLRPQAGAWWGCAGGREGSGPSWAAGTLSIGQAPREPCVQQVKSGQPTVAVSGGPQLGWSSPSFRLDSDGPPPPPHPQRVRAGSRAPSVLTPVPAACPPRVQRGSGAGIRASHSCPLGLPAASSVPGPRDWLCLATALPAESPKKPGRGEEIPHLSPGWPGPLTPVGRAVGLWPWPCAADSSSLGPSPLALPHQSPDPGLQGAGLPRAHEGSQRAGAWRPLGKRESVPPHPRPQPWEIPEARHPAREDPLEPWTFGQTQRQQRGQAGA